MYAFMYVCMHVCMFICMYVMYVSMYECLCVCHKVYTVFLSVYFLTDTLHSNDNKMKPGNDFTSLISNHCKQGGYFQTLFPSYHCLLNPHQMGILEFLKKRETFTPKWTLQGKF